MIVLRRNLPMRWWIVGLAAYSFRLSFTSNAGVWMVGYYVQNLGWEWLYWQNAVVALMMMILTLLGTPRETINHQLLAKADWSGMLLFGAGLALIYAGLDQGNRLDWFESGTVIALLAGGSALVCFLVNEAVVAELAGEPDSADVPQRPARDGDDDHLHDHQPLQYPAGADLPRHRCPTPAQVDRQPASPLYGLADLRRHGGGDLSCTASMPGSWSSWA